MVHQIMNGGIELGILNAIGDEELSEADRERKAYLESLPKGVWITLDENGLAISEEEAEEREREHFKKFTIR